MTYQVQTIRKSFPFFDAIPVAYLDNAATAQKPQVVLDAMNEFYRAENAPVYRGIYPLAELATERYEGVRAQIARFIGALPEEIVFTRGATDGINLLAGAWSSMITAGDEIVISTLEHHANILSWQRLAAQKGATCVWLPLHETDALAWVEKCITQKTKLVVCTLDSNVLGPITPEILEAIVKRAHVVGAKVLFDAAQAAPHRALDVQALGCDFLVFSGHKLYGPTASGVLYVRRSEHANLLPYQLGGGMVTQVSVDGACWQGMPTLLEAGTPAVAEVIGLGAAISYLQTYSTFEECAAYEQHLVERALTGISRCPGVRIISNHSKTAGAHILTFTVDGLHPHDVAAYLAVKGVCVRAGYHCCQPLHAILGLTGSVRMSVGLYTTEQEIDMFVEAIDELTTRPGVVTLS